MTDYQLFNNYYVLVVMFDNFIVYNCFNTISGLLLSSMFFAQVIINPGNKTSVSNPSVSLEFGDDARGLILPYVEGSAANTAVAGTFIMDPADKRVKLKLADGTWQNLSGAAQVTNSILSAPSTIQENATSLVQ